MNKIKVFLIIFLVTAAGSIFAQRIGTAGASELLIPVGARGVALGSSVLTTSQGADAIFWNPANLARSTDGVDVLASHMNYIADIGVEYGAIGVNVGSFGHLGFSIKGYSFGDITKTTVQNPDGTGQTFSPQYLTIGATYSKMLSDRVSVGLNVNYISETLDLVSASGLGFDVGVTYSDVAGVSGLDFAVILKNLGPDMTFDGSGLFLSATADGQARGDQFYKISAAAFSLPTSLDIGVGYRLNIDDQNMLNLNGSFSNNNFYTDQYRAGAEYSYDNLLFFRAGYIYTADFESSDVVYKFSAGFGLHYDLGGVNFKLDYAYLPAEFFSDTHVFSIGLGL